MREAADRQPAVSPRRRAPQPDARTIADSRSGATTASGASESAMRIRKYAARLYEPDGDAVDRGIERDHDSGTKGKPAPVG